MNTWKVLNGHTLSHTYYLKSKKHIITTVNLILIVNFVILLNFSKDIHMFGEFITLWFTFYSLCDEDHISSAIRSA